MGERRGTRGLELWCKRMTEGYPGVKVENMTTSWRDGLAFCAIIHHFRPDLIEFSKLNKNDIYNNNNLAFRIAEDHLGIPALLEPEDMVEYPVPDRLSILTYLSQFYQVFAVNSNSTKVPSKRPPPADLQRHMVGATGSSTPKKAALGVLGARREPCTKCALPVFIAERLNVGKALYHRTCFRCARCDSQLTLANYYETENGEFCCETCPDEEKPSTSHEVNILGRSLSDEEKSASLKDSDPYSANFENVLEDPDDGSLKRNFTLDRLLGAQFVKARTDFMTTQMATSSSDSETESEDKPPDLPVSLVPQLVLDDNQHSENIHLFSNNLLPSLSDNFSVSSDQITPDQEHCESQDSVTKDSISPSIRCRMKLFEASVEGSVKSDVNKERVKISENYVEVSQPKTPVEKVEQLSFDDTCENDASINVDQAEVVEGILLKDSSTSSLEDSKYLSANTNIFSDASKTNQTNEVICLSSDICLEPLGSSSLSVISCDHSEVPEENSVIIISESDDSRCQPDVAPSDDLESPIENSEQPAVVEYPDDLNPFGDDEETEESAAGLSSTVEVGLEIVEPDPAASLNPFGDTDDEEEESPIIDKRPIPAPRLIVPPKGLNPFGSDDEEEEKVNNSSSLPPQPSLRKLKAPKISLTPFWQENDSPIQDTFSTPPNSRSESISLTGSSRKKKPAPKPPISSIFQDSNDSPFSSLNSSPSQSLSHLPNAPARSRKMRRAPQPPASTPRSKLFQSTEPAYSPIDEKSKTMELKPLQFKTGSEENLKTNRDETELSRNKTDSNSVPEGPSSLPNKSTYGKWKRRKGQAPARPIPQRRTVKRLPLNEIKQELEVIEIQQLGLEKQGVTLEKIIRERSETPGTNTDDTLAPEVEDMILQLFELVNEKNELFRKQTELMYLRRQYRLEEEHAEIEYQIRCLMLQPDANKTDSDKAKEEELLSRMIEIVERRNEIVDCLEMERRREAEEDNSIRNQLNLYSIKREGEHSSSKKFTKKDKHKHKKDKEKKNRKNKGNMDKDMDESLQHTSKDKKKKKMLGLF